MDIKEKILDALKASESALKTAEIAEILQVDKGIVDKTIKELKKDNLIVSPKRCYYSVEK